jgi:amino acid adenylation domain-containing protein
VNSDTGTNPFEIENSLYLALTNGEDQYSLWPAHIAVPSGWEVALPVCAREECLDFIARVWTDMRPSSLRSLCRDPSSQGIAWTTIPQLFARQAAETPDAEALISEAGRLTYAELESRVERISRVLVEHRVEPGQVVAVLLERSEDLVATILAVQVIGAAYLPVDTGYPAERINYILSDSKPICVVSTSRYENVYRGAADKTTVVLLDEEESAHLTNNERPSQAPRSSRAQQPHPLDAAYIIYTSGSTGRPKGVVVSQLAIVNHLLWRQRHYSLGTDDRVLQKTPAGFDVSVWEFFWPLIVGATLVVAGPEAHKSPGELVEIILRERVTTTHFVPSMLNLFLEEAGIADCTSLRRVFVGGEALSLETLRRFSELLSATLYNLYGPTETAIDVTAWECTTADLTASRIPIGFSVANTGAYVLDDHLRPVAAGAEGELYLTGVQIARCYLNNPVLTAERFVACPFVHDGQRMYRTGDLVKWNEDGALDFIGRMDTQLKLNGIRIEVGEVESVLMEHPAISQAVVVPNRSIAAAPSLAAFLTANNKNAAIATMAPEHLIRAVRAFAEQVLPAYMIPASMTVLPHLPLNANGKIDRAGLDTNLLISPPMVSLCEPRSDSERTLCGLVGKILGLADIGPDDNFFALGGESLTAIRLVSAITRAFNIPFKLRVLLSNPRISDLALCIEEVRKKTGS